MYSASRTPKMYLDTAAMGAVGFEPVINRQVPLYPGYARIWANYPGEIAHLARDVSKLFSGKLAVVPGTIRPIAGEAKGYSMIVTQRRRSLPNTAETVKTHEMASFKPDQFIDQAGDIWDVSPDGKTLFSKAKETLEVALASRPFQPTTSIGVYQPEEVASTDFVAYFSPEGTIKYGSYIGGKRGLVYDPATKKGVPVPEYAILDSVDHDLLQTEIAVKGNFEVDEPQGIQRLTAYLERVYGNFPAFWNTWKEKIADATKQYNQQIEDGPTAVVS